MRAKARAVEKAYATLEASLLRTPTDAEVAAEMPLDSPNCITKYQSSPRQAAGGPQTEDNYKCHLRPIDWADPVYASLSTAQRARLEAVFPSGVCDYSRRSIGWRTSPGWVTFSGPVPKALGRAPDSDDEHGQGGHDHHGDDDDD